MTAVSQRWSAATAGCFRTSNGRARQLELGGAQRALSAIPPAELTEPGRSNQAARLARLEHEAGALHAEMTRRCALAGRALGELRGRVAGKMDTLVAAERACAKLAGPPPTLCAKLPEARTAYEELLAALDREVARVASAECAVQEP